MSTTLDAGAKFRGFHVVIMLPVWYTFLSAYCVATYARPSKYKLEMKYAICPPET